MAIRTMLSNKTYDVVKDVVTLWLPALGTFYFAFAQIWGLPFAEQVVGSIAAVVTLLGAILKVSTKNYEKSEDRFDGELVISHTDPMKETYSLELTSGLMDIQNQNELILKVNNTQ